jgi:hypothetical protein
LLLEKMDVIYVVLDGRAVEHGTHDELIAASSSLSPDRVARGRLMQLPVADTATVRTYAKRLIRHHRSKLVRMLSLYALAAFMALIPAYIIGEITNFAADHQLTAHRITLYVGILVRLVDPLRRASFLARRRSYVLGETVFAQLREEFLESVLALPLVEVERAGTGDLLSRTTNDIEALSRTVRFAVPEWLVAIVQAVLTLIAMTIVSPVATVASLVSLPFLFSRRATTCATRRPAIDANESATPPCRARSLRRPKVRAPSTRTDSGPRQGSASKETSASPSTPRCTRCFAHGLVPHDRKCVRARGRHDARLERVAGDAPRHHHWRRDHGDALRRADQRPDRPHRVVARRTPESARRRWRAWSACRSCATTARPRVPNRTTRPSR